MEKNPFPVSRVNLDEKSYPTEKTENKKLKHLGNFRSEQIQSFLYQEETP